MSDKNMNFSREQITQLRDYILDPNHEPSVAVFHLLSALGFKPNLYGFNYLHHAILYCFNLPGISKVSLSREVYPAVSLDFDTAPKCIERDIRTALSDCYFNGEMLKINLLANYNIISEKYPPTNGEFIMKIVSWLKLEYAEQTQKVDFVNGGGGIRLKDYSNSRKLLKE